MADEAKVVVFGASGAVGAALSSRLAQADDISLRLVDVDTSAVETLASDRVEVVQCDLSDRRSAAKACEGASMLMNCLSLTHFDHVFDLAAEHGLDYADLISEPSEDQIARAEAGGILAVPGIGISPGLSNILVAHAAKELEPYAVEILFAIFRTIAPSRGALDTVLWEAGEYCPERNYYDAGQLIPAGPTQGGRVVDFGRGFGTLEVFVRPHPEPKSLPKNFPSIRFCAVRGGWQPEMMADLSTLNRLGLLDQEHGPATKEAIWSRWGGVTSERYAGQSTALVEVRGIKAGVCVKRTYDLGLPTEIPVYPLTGIVAAPAARLIARRRCDRVGVLEPEVFFDPYEYLTELKRQGVIDLRWRDEPDGES